MLNFREDNNFIIINEKAFVPGKGKGPFVKPFQASGSQIRLFRRLGLHVTIVDEDYEYPSSKKDNEEDKDERNPKSSGEKSQEKQSNGEESSKESKVDGGKDQEVSETIDDKVDEKIEEKVEEAESEKEEEETAEESKEVEVTEEDLNEFTVAELKEELDSKEIEYANNARKKDLIELLLQNQ